MSQLVSNISDSRSEAGLRKLYAESLIPAEKKPFLIDANECSGAFLKVENSGYILDIASQIASLGLGFNAGALFGTAQYLESWLGHTDTDTASSVRVAFAELLQRQVGSDQFQIHLCSSGAEAIEIGLGVCFAHFAGQRRKILAFEKSFHGRMLVALSCTWNRAKREPFAWPHFATEFAPYPELWGDDITLSQPTTHDQDLERQELEILSLIEHQLLSNQFMAVLIEPMQCEGGERYSSARFHQGLIQLCRSYGVPLIYDEIQTGFGLGKDFFWHRGFGLIDGQGNAEFPDIVIGAKKAQLGVVMTRLPLPEGLEEQYHFASLARGYIQASVIDQFAEQIVEIEAMVRDRLDQLVRSFAELIVRPRANGLSFAFDFHDIQTCKRFIDERFRHGLLYYPAGERTARFRLNMSFRQSEIEFAFSKIQQVLSKLSNKNHEFESPELQIPSPQRYAMFHTELMRAKRSARSTGNTPSSMALDFLQQELSIMGLPEHSHVQLLDQSTYLSLRTEIEAIQRRVYEPARQTPLEEFDRLFESEQPLAIVVLDGQKILGMGFAGRLGLFREVSGVENDAYVDDPKAYYMLDLTVDEDFRGGLGRLLKQTMTLLATEQGISAIHGRNRDRLAGGMWAINLSLGSFTTQVLKDNYRDDSPYRDCLYYRCPTIWQTPPLNLSNAIDCPLGPDQLNDDFCRQHLGVLINKLTHSNFITGDMARQLPEAFEIFGKPLRHGYTSSSLSEAVDKIVKVIWLRRKPRTKLVAVRGSFWGQGSCLTRSLSQLGRAFFDVEFVPPPSEIGDRRFIEQVESLLDDDCLALFVEPIMTQTIERLDEATLSELLKRTRAVGVPVIYNETAGQFYRYSSNQFSPSHCQGLEPEGSVSFLGGQMALVGVHKDYFADEPLMLISTWDGDAYSLARFVEAQRHVTQNCIPHQQLVKAFSKKLCTALDNANVRYHIENGVGWVEGDLPSELNQSVQYSTTGRALILPTYWQMQSYLNDCHLK